MSTRRKGKNAPPRLQSKSTPNLTTLHDRRDEQHEGLTGGDGQVDERLPGAVDTESDDFEEDSEDDETEDHDHLSPNRPLQTSRSHSHLRQHPPNPSTLFPPFYNRPPIPIPPSPSLTSLLRPSFASRPTTPDSSDIELSSTRTASASRTSNLSASAKHAPRIPRAAPKVPTYEYYGFAMYLGSSAAFLIYVLWAYVPAPMLHQMGIYYYPNRWWALAIPCWLVALIIYIYVALAAYNTGYLTLRLGSVECLVDEAAQVAVVDRNRDGIGIVGRVDGQGDLEKYRFGAGEELEWKGFWGEGTDAVMDVPIGGVCEVLYGE